MYVGDFQIDRTVSRESLVAAVAAALDVARDGVSIWPAGNVTNPSTPVILQLGRVGGDFPTLVRLSADDSIAARAKQDLLALVREIATFLDAGVLTDSVATEPAFDDDWLLVTPDGATAIVQADLDALQGDPPAVVLVPESRATYARLMHRRLAAAG